MNPHACNATLERLIVGKAVDHLLCITDLRVETGDKEPLLALSDDPFAIVAAALSGPNEVWLFAADKTRFVKLVIGNGTDVISDYHVDLEDILKPANDLAKALEG